jgi:hypothetical protein
MKNIFCNFTYSDIDHGRYNAICSICGRQVRTRTTKAIASCRSNTKKHTVSDIMQATGFSPGSSHPIMVGGPGTELKKLLKDWLGIEATPTCRCNSMSARMDALGSEWCLSDIGMTEIVEVMRNEHTRRKESGDTILPWTDFGAKALIKLACKRADTPL